MWANERSITELDHGKHQEGDYGSVNTTTCFGLTSFYDSKEGKKNDSHTALITTFLEDVLRHRNVCQ